MNNYLSKLGVTGTFQFHDVYGVDEGLLAMVPQPCIAVMLLFPISENSEKHKEEEAKALENKDQGISENLYYMKQTVCLCRHLALACVVVLTVVWCLGWQCVWYNWSYSCRNECSHTCGLWYVKLVEK